jgi:hypothetical protein
MRRAALATVLLALLCVRITAGDTTPQAPNSRRRAHVAAAAAAKDAAKKAASAPRQVKKVVEGEDSIVQAKKAGEVGQQIKARMEEAKKSMKKHATARTLEAKEKREARKEKREALKEKFGPEALKEKFGALKGKKWWQRADSDNETPFLDRMRKMRMEGGWSGSVGKGKLLRKIWKEQGDQGVLAGDKVQALLKNLEVADKINWRDFDKDNDGGLSRGKELVDLQRALDKEIDDWKGTLEKNPHFMEL